MELEKLHFVVLAKRESIMDAGCFHGNKSIHRIQWPVSTYARKLAVPLHYRNLLLWSTKHYFSQDCWKMIDVIGYSNNEPVMEIIETGEGITEEIITDATMFLEKDNQLFVLSLDGKSCPITSLYIESYVSDTNGLNDLVRDLQKFMLSNNIYRNQVINFDGNIRFHKHRGLVNNNHQGDLHLDTLCQKIIASTIDYKDSPIIGIPVKHCMLMQVNTNAMWSILNEMVPKLEGMTRILINIALVTPVFIDDIYSLATDLTPSVVLLYDPTGPSSKGMDLPKLLAIVGKTDKSKGIYTVAMSCT